MPNKKAAIKALRSSKRKREENRIVKKNLKDVIKKANSKNLDKVYSTIDKAAKKNVICKNKAARIKSKIAKSVKVESKPKTVTKPKAKAKAKPKAKKTK